MIKKNSITFILALTLFVSSNVIMSATRYYDPTVDVNAQEARACFNLTPLMNACRNGNLDEVIECLQDPMCNPNAQDAVGKTALHYTLDYFFNNSTSRRNNTLNIIEQLLAREIAVNIRDKRGRTAVNYACEQLNIIFNILNSPHDSNYYDPYDQYNFNIMRIIHLLISHNAHVDFSLFNTVYELHNIFSNVETENRNILRKISNKHREEIIRHREEIIQQCKIIITLLVRTHPGHCIFLLIRLTDALKHNQNNNTAMLELKEMLESYMDSEFPHLQIPPSPREPETDASSLTPVSNRTSSPQDGIDQQSPVCHHRCHQHNIPQNPFTRDDFGTNIVTSAANA